MKNLFRFIGFIAIFTVFLWFPSASQAERVETIKDFQVITLVKEDRTVEVTETITYLFSESKHGIYREIPTRYERNGGRYLLRLNVKSVLMDGHEVPYKIESRNPVLRIRIGDEDERISGERVFTIVYETDRALLFFDENSEFYWNVTGDEWDVPIQKVRFSLVGPGSYEANNARAVCYIGAAGSSKTDGCRIVSQANTVQMETTDVLNKREGMTVAIEFPKGLIAAPTTSEKIKQFLVDNGILGLPIIAFIIMFILWYRKGKEPAGRGTIVPQYKPPENFSPMEMQALEKQASNATAITATILSLAERGYLRIIYGEEKKFFGLGAASRSYSFEKKKEADSQLKPFEKEILDGLFSEGEDLIEDTELKKTFYKTVQQAQSSMMSTLASNGYFVKNPSSVRATYIAGGIVLGALSFWLIPFFGYGTMGVVSVVAASVIVMAFGWFMPAKTHKGAVALEEIMGFKWFLSVTEKDRLAFHQAPELKPEQFHAFLPFAVAFGVEEKWAKQFEHLTVGQPDYVQGYGAGWNPLLFAHSIHAMDASLAQSAYAPPSSAGSGHSGFSGGGVGGGFGGGGGGSW